MIDFRYHLVTIIAIFLALAIGIVVGTTALNGAVVTNLHHDVQRLQDTGDKLNDLTSSESSELSRYAALVSAAEPALVRNRISGMKVAVVGLPGTSGAQRSALAALLVGAGARVTTEIGLSTAIVATSQQALLGAVSADYAPSGARQVSGKTPDQALASVLAAGLVDRPGLDSATASEVVTGLAAYHFLVNDLHGAALASAVVLLTPNGPSSPPATTSPVQADEVGFGQNLADELSAVAPVTVVAGPRSAEDPGGLLNALRGAVLTDKDVSVVDGTDTPVGQVATVLALAAGRLGEFGGFGVLAGDSPLPSGVLPSTLPTATSPASLPASPPDLSNASRPATRPSTAVLAVSPTPTPTAT